MYKHTTTTPGEIIMHSEKHLSEAIERLGAAEDTYKDADTDLATQTLIEAKLAQAQATIAIAHLLLAEQMRKENP